MNDTIHLLPESKRPNKLNQIIGHIDVLEHYVKFTKQRLSTQGKFKIILFSKISDQETTWEKFIFISKFTNAIRTIVLSLMNIYKILENTMYRNQDLELTMINTMRTIREQTEIPSTNSGIETTTNQLTNRIQIPNDQFLTNDQHESQVLLEFKDTIESEILLISTQLSHDIDQLIEHTTYYQKVALIYNFIFIKIYLEWVCKNRSYYKLNYKINGIIKSLIIP